MFRIGHGFDVHQLVKQENAGLPLAAVFIPCNYRVVAHSDGDVVLHALTDAILGAAGLGDIGEHFPPSDDEWKDADSKQFVKFAVNSIRQRGARLVNVDLTILAERPRIKDYKPAMREILSDLLELPLDAVNIKATTTEKLGFIGREEGIAAEAVCLIAWPQ